MLRETRVTRSHWRRLTFTRLWITLTSSKLCMSGMLLLGTGIDIVWSIFLRLPCSKNTQNYDFLNHLVLKMIWIWTFRLLRGWELTGNIGAYNKFLNISLLRRLCIVWKAIFDGGIAHELFEWRQFFVNANVWRAPSTWNLL